MPLPPELLRLIAGNIDEQSTLLGLRLVSKGFGVIFTPLAFRLITVSDSLRRGQALAALQECEEELVSNIREIVFHGDPLSPTDNPSNWISVDVEEGLPRRRALQSAFAALNKFPKLEHLRLDFHNTWQEEDIVDIPEQPTHFLLLQNALFSALASCSPAPKLVSVTLHNVLAVPDAIYAQPEFQSFFSTLQTLDLSVLSDAESEGSYYQTPLATFWDTSMAHIVRSAKSARSLTIRSDQSTGAYPALSFAATCLPNLEELSLTKFVLDTSSPDSDVALFIVKHKRTLRRLELHDCTIDGGEDLQFPRPWFAVFNLFNDELIHLRSFVFQSIARRGRRAPIGAKFGYTRLDPGWGYMPLNEEDGPVQGADLDAPTLEGFLAAVAARS
ncbi:Pribosyltran domain-containing protein [Mycena indigotica]|uniref:Pribosyltran domain-containing protein n=1 Tax=Mycena indigotica TaxID=2126181 RepID=A0A8H6SIL9_9AGAR|nr:Pribosyltran domain-containing protein [Mycena indigotica]KAF7299445.1 Pribosyltran domain-containing protein [Mycena indigotica]